MRFRKCNNDAVCSVSLRLTKSNERNNYLFQGADIQGRKRNVKGQ